MSYAVIYMPIELVTLDWIWKGQSKFIIVSSLVAISHGFAHVVYPFLNEHTGVVYEVDVWQDQVLHSMQGVLVFWLWYKNVPRHIHIIALVFTMGLFANAIVGFFCWGKECHEVYVWISLIPAMSSGMHFAMGGMFNTGAKVTTYGIIIQTFFVTVNYFVFRASDDILKVFALTRFFEIYAIAPHLVSFMRSKVTNNEPAVSKSPLGRRMSREFMREPRRMSRELVQPENWGSNSSYFGDDDKKGTKKIE